MSNWSEWRAQVDLDGYEARWQQMVDDGANPHGEADFVGRFAPASVLDAGCGTGRVGIELARRGIDVVGTDLDADMLSYARKKAPHIDWVHADLVDLDLGGGRRIGPRGADATLDHVAHVGVEGIVALVVALAVEAQALGELRVADRRVALDPAPILPRGLVGVARLEEEPRVEQDRLRGRVRALREVFEEDERQGGLVLLAEGVGQPEFEGGVVGGQRQGVAVLDLGQVGLAPAEQGLGQQSAERQVVGREAQRLAERL